MTEVEDQKKLELNLGKKLASIKPEDMEKALKGAQLYIQRYSKQSYVEGSFDNAKRFYPEGRDMEVMRDDVRSPSRSWPYSYMRACTSKEHCARYFNADADAVGTIVRAAEKLKFPLGDSDGIEKFKGKIKELTQPIVEKKIQKELKQELKSVKTQEMVMERF